MFSSVQQPFANNKTSNNDNQPGQSSNIPPNQRVTRSNTQVFRDENKGLGNQEKSAIISKNHPTTRSQLKRTALEDVSNVQAPPMSKAQKAKASASSANLRSKLNNNANNRISVASSKKSTSSIAKKFDHAGIMDVDSKSSTVNINSASMDEDSQDACDHEKVVEAQRKQIRHKHEDVNWDDLDAVDAGDPLMISDYVVEIFEYMRELETKIIPNPRYLDNQPDIKANMRAILIDWLVEVHWKFKLLPETLFLTVNIIDRFLSLRIVHLSKLQLVGVVAMLIGSKYEEILAPSITNFSFLSDKAFEDSQIIEAERYVLSTLGFNLAYPNPMVFLRRISKAEDYDIQTRTVAKYLMEITLIDERFIGSLPSLIAASAVWLARKMLNRGTWNPNLIHYSGYSEDDVKPCVDLMISNLGHLSKHKAIYKKYESRKFMRASVFVADYIRKHY